MKHYLVSYRHDDGEWNIDLPAESREDARQRLSKLAMGRVEGEIVATIPGALGPFAALAVTVRNLFARP
jgi:hypothetical protein